jgi:uncharacterized protein YneF (UPF0154 family)
MEFGIIMALIVGLYLGFYEKQNSLPKYILRNRTIIDDIIGN